MKREKRIILERNRGGYVIRPCDIFAFWLDGGVEWTYSSSHESSDVMTTCWRTGTWLGMRRVSPQVAVST